MGLKYGLVLRTTPLFHLITYLPRLELFKLGLPKNNILDLVRLEITYLTETKHFFVEIKYYR